MSLDNFANKLKIVIKSKNINPIIPLINIALDIEIPIGSTLSHFQLNDPIIIIAMFIGRPIIKTQKVKQFTVKYVKLSFLSFNIYFKFSALFLNSFFFAIIKNDR